MYTKENNVNFSVIVPTHRRGDLLEKLINSLENQSYPRELFEVIVVADESDEAFSLVERFQKKGSLTIRCLNIPSDPWNGKSAAAKRNFGAGVAENIWLAFTDDDCTVDRDWLNEAEKVIINQKAVAIEGRKHIPETVPPTLTYKGLLSFTHPGGYQTCNMFFLKSLFNELGGFDLNFPFYFEDSDFAWTVMEKGHKIFYAERAIITHPVLPEAPWKLLDAARRVIRLPYLFKKHPTLFKASNMRPIGFSSAVYLWLYAILMPLIFVSETSFILVSAMLILAVTILHSYKLFRRCAFSWDEWWVTTVLLPIVPIVKFIQLIRGNIKQRVFLI